MTENTINQTIDSLSSSIKKSPGLVEDTILWKGGELPKGWEEGNIYKIGKFFSTSFNKQRALSFRGEGYLFKIFADKNAKAAILIDDMTQFPNEKEALFDYEQEIEVIKIDHKNKLVAIRVRS